MDDNTLTKILNPAKMLFLEKGYKATTINDIARAANVSPSTIYLHFNGKKELFRSLGIPKAEEFDPRAETRRVEILQIALLLFGENGFDGTSMDMIAKKCGFSKALLYQYYDSKESLYSAVMKETPFHYNFLSIQPEIEKEDLLSAIKKIGLAYLSIFKTPERLAFTRAIIADSNKHPDVGPIYHKNGIGYVSNCVTNCLEKAKDQLLPDIDLALAAKTYVGSLFGLAVQYRVVVGVERTYSDEEIVNTSAEIFIRGISRVQNS